MIAPKEQEICRVTLPLDVSSMADFAESVQNIWEKLGYTKICLIGEEQNGVHYGCVVGIPPSDPSDPSSRW